MGKNYLGIWMLGYLDGWGKNFLGSPPPQAFREFSSTPEFLFIVSGNFGVEINSRKARGGGLPKKFFSPTIKISPATNTRKRLTCRRVSNFQSRIFRHYQWPLQIIQ